MLSLREAARRRKTWDTLSKASTFVLDVRPASMRYLEVSDI